MQWCCSGRIAIIIEACSNCSNIVARRWIIRYLTTSSPTAETTKIHTEVQAATNRPRDVVFIAYIVQCTWPLFGAARSITIGLISAPLSILSKGEWGHLECLYRACQSAITVGLYWWGLTDIADTGVNERGENWRPSENDHKMKTFS